MRLRWFQVTRVAAKVVALGILIVLFPFGEVVHTQDGATQKDTVDFRPRAVAVVPFANVSGQPDDEWIGAGIAETVIADLEQFGGLSVVSREALVGLANSDRTGATPVQNDESVARDLARQLGVSWIVSGGFQRLGDQLRITARIVSVESGAAHETVKVDGGLNEIFTLQDRIVTGLADGFARIAGRESAPPSIAPRPSPAGRPQTGGGEGEDVSVVSPRSGQGRGSGGGGAFGAAPGGRAPIGATAGSGSDRPAGAVTGGIAIGAVGNDQAPQMASAAPVGNAGALAGRVTVRPVRTQTPPTIDGRLDDEVWRDAYVIRDFVQSEPLDGAPASEETDVYLAYDSSNLYLGFHARYSDPGIMRANRVDRDRADRGDDVIRVYFDPFLDQQRAYSFSVNGYGVQGDAIVGGSRSGGFGGRGGGGPSGAIPRGDSSWDALFTTGGRLVDDGFTAEMAIPFKSLRYPARGLELSHTWGFQIVRRIRAKDETVVWSPVSRDVAGFLPQMGVLDGMTGLSTSRNLEIQPTFTAFRFGTLDEEIGEVVDADPRPEGGANFKYGLTSDLVADFTLNPDFSQIESDRPQVEVNQRFALFFPELRPFFLEGAEIFQIQAPINAVHTRTIVDPLYGAKLTGKAGNAQIGVLYANDEAASLEIDDPLNPGFDQSAQTFVGRVRYDLYAESFIGAIVTDREFLDGSSRLVGIDSNFRIGDTHSVGFSAMRTDHQETTDHLEEVAGLRTDGYLLDFGFRKRGRNLSYSLDAYSLSPEFKTDVGFVRRTDERRVGGQVEYEWWPQDWLISWGPEVRYRQNYDFEDVLQDEQFRARVRANFAKNIRSNADIDQDMERYEGIDFDKRRYNLFSFINTSRLVSVGGGYRWGDEIYFDAANPFLGRESGLRTFITVRPASRLSSDLNITTSRFTDPNGFFVPDLNEGERDANGEIFDVKIFRALTTYQFTDRLLFRNIAEVNTYDETLGLNFLFTYRVNSGTAFYIGYDDHYRQREQFEDQVNITGSGYQQTNRAIFTKFQYLFRY